MRIEPTGATLGAVVTGVRLAELDDATWEAIHAAFLEHAVLIFPGQHLTDDEQVSFARRFGPIEHIVEGMDSVPITNQRRDGTVRDPDDPALELVLGNTGWHTDSSYMPVSARASVLSALVVPPEGGETSWADMRAAWDALDPATRDRIEHLCAHHSLEYSQARAGYGRQRSFAYGFHGRAPLRPLVKVHPETGRRALFIGRHAHAIVGMDPAESERLLDELLEFACRPPRVITHRWSPGDVVVWDNRCVLHRAHPWDLSQPRTMRHTRISGDPRTEAALEVPERRA